MLFQTLINILLAFDAYLSWYYPYRRSIPFDSPLEMREDRAFENMHLAIDMFEMYERLSINNHKSFLPHLTVYKVRFPHLCAYRIAEKYFVWGSLSQRPSVVVCAQSTILCLYNVLGYIPATYRTEPSCLY